jgi:hypothetical protein
MIERNKNIAQKQSERSLSGAGQGQCEADSGDA